MRYTEINIKSDMPMVGDAMKYLQDTILRLKKEKYECVLIVHGYGSTGKGGAICEKCRQWLKAQERNKKVKTVIFGEDFEIFNFKALELKNKYKELSPLMNVCNHGVTVVEL
jgi:hypothetical protein